MKDLEGFIYSLHLLWIPHNLQNQSAKRLPHKLPLTLNESSLQPITSGSFKRVHMLHSIEYLTPSHFLTQHQPGENHHIWVRG